MALVINESSAIINECNAGIKKFSETKPLSLVILQTSIRSEVWNPMDTKIKQVEIYCSHLRFSLSKE